MWRADMFLVLHSIYHLSDNMHHFRSPTFLFGSEYSPVNHIINGHNIATDGHIHALFFKGAVSRSYIVFSIRYSDIDILAIKFSVLGETTSGPFY